MSFATVAKQHVAANAAMTTTTNGALSHSTTGSARVDLFYGAMRDVDKTRLMELLTNSYAEDPLHTLKLVAYIRDCRGGKGERLVGRHGLEWLAEHAPAALAHNLKHYVGEYGRFDDPCVLMGSSVENQALDLLKSQLEMDLVSMRAKKSVSLCAKWIPSEKKALDKQLKMNKKLSARMGLKPADLRKQYLAPLRQHLNILERQMCAKQWDEIDFSKVPSVAMHIHGKPKHAFERHVEEKFGTWKSGLATGKTKVNAAVLFPHEVVSQYFSRSAKDELLEAQWDVMVQQAKSMGDLNRTLVLSDVSGSMSGRPMEVSIALGLMVSSLAQDEYKDLVLTFESNPRFHHVKGANLYERVNNLLAAPWGGSTNFAAAFRAILRLAKEAHLRADQMPERLIVVSDMQFDCADRNYETNFQVLKREFQEANYDVPHLVFWNVNGSTRDCPTHAGEAKVSLVSGFSTAILKSVLAGKDITPLETVLAVVMDERYDVITMPRGENEEEGVCGDEDDMVVL